ncbi:MAG: immunoglobulin domain-containing protein [Verrucomicrobia bacterium]|nr:immunoglobulin domain-containing protein [Verrucomicrobiota bacterium]
MKAKIALLTILLAGLSALTSRAAQVTTTTYSNSGFTVDTSQDLVLNVLPTTNGHTGSLVIPTLTNGQAPAQIPGYDGNNVIQDRCVLTFDMGAAATVNEIQTYSTWPDGGRVLQDYTVDVSLDGGTWTTGVVSVVNQGLGNSGSWPGVKVAVTTDDSSPLAVDVRYIRFNFPSTQNGGVGYQEIVVNGVSFALPEAPVFTEIPQDQTVTSGDSVTFTAQATGFPVPIITWHFIDSSSVDHTLSTVGNTLTFRSHLSDAGQYYAVASNSAGTVNSTPAAVLTVNPNPVVATTSYSTSGFTVDTSQDLILSVLPSVSGNTGTTSIPGLTDGQAPNSIPGYDGNNLLNNGVTLTYDLGAEATLNELQSYSAWPGDRYLQDYTVDFSQDGFNWTNGAISVVNQGTGTLGGWNNVKVSIARNDSLPLATNARYVRFNFNNQQNGAVGYTELVVNGVTFGLPEAPVFTEIPLSQTVTSGDSVTFTAQATGYPVPTITWHFIDSSSVDHLLPAVGNTLTFRSHLSDAGQYYAVASNSEGTVNSTPAAVLTVNPGPVEETDLSLSGGSFAALGANDLILGNAGTSALSITTDGDGVGSASLLTNGDLGAPQTGGPLGITGGSITYDLGSGANGAGYDITGIRSLSAWADGGRFKPKYTVSYSADGFIFTPLWTVNYSTATGNGADVSLAINSLHNVRQVKFDFSGGQQNGWVSYRELAVFGTSSAATDPFAAWINGLDWSGFTSPDKTPTGDPDGDGMNNQQEFAFGLDPRFGSSVNPLTQQLNQATGTFKYTRTKASGLSYVYQYSTTLSEPWDAFESETPLPDSVSISDTVEEVTVTVPAALLNANSRLFVRVAAQ